MKISGISLVLWVIAISSLAAQGSSASRASVSSTLRKTTEALHATKIQPNEVGQTLVPLVNRNGWVNPEDLTPMPQCIAQQNHSSWLSAMTKCTSKQCTSHFGVICTHHQWLTQLSCLSTGFSPNVVELYLPYCSRSVLAKAQLFRWIHTITGRTWLVDVGDANGLQTLSPASLAGGYAAVNVTDKAPTCLMNSASATSMEPFQHVMASCGFTSNTQHTGNVARPWEYSEALRSVVALDFETAGYNVTHHDIRYGNYFDKRCFCDAFSTDLKMEPCSGTGLALTRERLWLNATCGSASVPGNWTNGLQTTTFAYIPIERWHWPKCVTDMPKKGIRLTDQCTTDACKPDSSGYCNIKRAIDRACFCRNINYNTCKGSCHVFETRIDYVKWLHDLCGSEQEWHGLPKHWRHLAAPTRLDMMPWGWSIKPIQSSNSTSGDRLGLSDSMQTCASIEWKLGSLVLINMATLLTGFFVGNTATNPIAHVFQHYFRSRSWLQMGCAIAALHLFANWLNAILIQATLGYEEVPMIQMILLWCSMPRSTVLTVLMVVFQPFQARSFSTVASCLFAETILQILSAYHMVTTVNYGREHSFYSYGMGRLAKVPSAQYMYAGALMWLVTVVVTLVLLLQAIHRAQTSTTGAGIDEPKTRTGKRTIPSLVQDLVAPFNEFWTRLEDILLRCWMDKSRDPEQTLPTSSEGRSHTVYGTLYVKVLNDRIIKRQIVRLLLIAIASMGLLWIAQWMFWTGFIGLGVEEFCPPKLGALTVIWILSSLAGAAVAVLW